MKKQWPLLFLWAAAAGAVILPTVSAAQPWKPLRSHASTGFHHSVPHINVDRMPSSTARVGLPNSLTGPSRGNSAEVNRLERQTIATFSQRSRQATAQRSFSVRHIHESHGSPMNFSYRSSRSTRGGQGTGGKVAHGIHR
jgi:hypothetical protein